MESLSSYARQFLGLMEKPDVDYIEGLSPAISIEQRTTHRNPRSTVGTITEIYDYLRLLFARVGKPYCPRCGREIASQSVDQIVDTAPRLPRGGEAPDLRAAGQGAQGGVQEGLRGRRPERVRPGAGRRRASNGSRRRLQELDKQKRHSIDVVVDRIVRQGGPPGAHRRVGGDGDGLTDGLVGVPRDDGAEELFSRKLACVHCGISYPEIQPRMFSFNSPYGACPECTGLGLKLEFDPDLIVPDKSSPSTGERSSPTTRARAGLATPSTHSRSTSGSHSIRR